jgi:hypothetical protein
VRGRPRRSLAEGRVRKLSVRFCSNDCGTPYAAGFALWRPEAPIESAALSRPDASADGGASLSREAEWYKLEAYRHRGRLEAAKDESTAGLTGSSELMSRAAAIERLGKLVDRELAGLDRAARNLEAAGDRIEAGKCRRAAESLRVAVEAVGKDG